MSRLNELLQQAGNIGRNEDGSITRLGFSEKYFQVLEFLKGRMQELGMQVETDPVGNLHGVLQGSDPAANPSCSVLTWIQLCRAVFMMECWV